MELLTVHETAKLLKVTTMTVRRYIADGRLPAVRVGKGVRVTKEAIEQLIQPVEPRAPVKTQGVTAGRPLTREDPLWRLVGAAASADPTDASGKYEHLSETLSSASR